MIRILFLIHDLGQGGAEKVLVNLVNNMNHEKFDISVIALFGGGINEQYLGSHIHYHAVFNNVIPANSKLMKLLTPGQLHKLIIKEKYDIEVSYLEGPTVRIISGCKDVDTKLVSWIHCTMSSEKEIAAPFRTVKECQDCYNQMMRVVFVSEGVKKAFINNIHYDGRTEILYNTIESNLIRKLATENVEEMTGAGFKLIAVGTLKEVKGFDRLFKIVKRLHDEKYRVNLYLLGIGPMQKELEQYIGENRLEDVITLLGYQTNPYKYIAKSDLYVCSSYAEGFSTAATEALIVGTPVCTVDVSGMKEMLGLNNEYGVVTDNSEDGLYEGIKKLITDLPLLSYYKERAIERGRKFNTDSTVREVERLFEELVEDDFKG